MTLSNGSRLVEPKTECPEDEGAAADVQGKDIDPSSTESFPEVSLLPTVHDILYTIEKDTQDMNQKNRDSLEASQKVHELTKKIESARSHIYKMQGISYSQQVQNQRLENLRQQLQMKKALIDKYKGLNMKLASLPSGQT